MKDHGWQVGKSVIAAIIWTVVLLYLSLAPGSEVSGLSILSRYHLDKLAHLVMYLIWVWLIGSAFRQNVLSHWWLLLFLIATFLGVALEYGQEHLSHGRTNDFWDMIFNGIGALIGALIVRHQSQAHARRTHAHLDHHQRT